MTGPMTSRLSNGMASEVVLNAVRAEMVNERRIVVALLKLMLLDWIWQDKSLTCGYGSNK